MSTMRRLLPLTAALAALAAAAPAAASAASWSAPANVSSATTFAGPIALTTTAGGALVAAWPWQQNTGEDVAGGARFAERFPAPPGATTPSRFGAEHVATDGLI